MIPTSKRTCPHGEFRTGVPRETHPTCCRVNFSGLAQEYNPKEKSPQRVEMSPQWFQSDPNRAPDSEFEPGELHHLCVGNEGRLLDFRRTPVRIEKLSDESGLATVQILAFEDQGALWDLP